MEPDHVPEADDIVWLGSDPQAGHAQAEHRPAVVLGPSSYNGRAGMIVCCPTTMRIKGYPFEVSLAGSPHSVVLADQVKSQDCVRATPAARARSARPNCRTCAPSCGR